jgi:hypothetical protein
LALKWVKKTQIFDDSRKAKNEITPQAIKPIKYIFQLNLLWLAIKDILAL